MKNSHSPLYKVFLSHLVRVYSIQGSHSSLYGILFSYLRWLRFLHSSFEWGRFKDQRLIKCFFLSASFDHLFLKLDVGVFKIVYRNYSNKCQKELINGVPLPLRHLRCTRSAMSAHKFSASFLTNFLSSS